MRQMELANDDLNVHAEVVFGAENLDYAAARALCRRGPVGNLHVNHQTFEIVPLAAAGLFAQDAVCVRGMRAMCGGLLRPRSSRPSMGRRRSFGLSFTVAGRPFHSARDDDLPGDLLIAGGQVVLARAVVKSAYHGGIAAGQHAQNAPLGPAVATHPSTRKPGARWGPRSVALAPQFHQHLIAMHGRADGLRVDVDVAREAAALAGVGDDEPVTVAVHRQSSGDQVLMGGRMFRQGVAIASGLDQPRALYQRLQSLGELLPFAAVQAHFADELLESRRAVRLPFDVP